MAAALILPRFRPTRVSSTYLGKVRHLPGVVFRFVVYAFESPKWVNVGERLIQYVTVRGEAPSNPAVVPASA